jgi:large subunit ribosomal protein L10
LAFSKKHKQELLAQYETWMRESKAVYMMSFEHMSMKEIDTLRAKAREAGGEAHVIKNTLMEKALQNLGLPIHDNDMVGTTLAGFAFEDVPAMAKTFNEAIKSDSFELKYGYLDGQLISAAQIKSLANLPPLPVMRASLLGTILAPATQLVRTLVEPARSLAAVTKAYSEKGAAA